MKNVLIVISGPSGVGKGTIVKRLISECQYKLSISCTTRKPRGNEIDGVDYFFIDKEDFVRKINNNGFLEYSEHFGNYYGTPKDFVVNQLKDNDVILEIDVNGGLNVEKNYKDVVSIFVMPPSFEELKNRLINRHTESEEKIFERLSRLDYELEKKSQYKYVVVNDDLDKTILEIENIIKKEKNK